MELVTDENNLQVKESKLDFPFTISHNDLPADVVSSVPATLGSAG